MRGNYQRANQGLSGGYIFKKHHLQPHLNLPDDDINFVKVDVTDGQFVPIQQGVEDPVEMFRISTHHKLVNDLRNDNKEFQNELFLEETKRRAKRALRDQRLEKRKQEELVSTTRVKRPLLLTFQ